MQPQDASVNVGGLQLNWGRACHGARGVAVFSAASCVPPAAPLGHEYLKGAYVLTADCAVQGSHCLLQFCEGSWSS